MTSARARPKVLIISMGGTILMTRNKKTRLLEPAVGSTDILKEMPGLAEIAKLDLLHLCNVDSSDMQPEMWTKLAQVIYERQDDYDGFVVTHGTDTLAYTTSALSLMLSTTKPVIFTGSQLPLVGQTATDAALNLAHAVEAATMDIGEVAVAFGSVLLRGSRVHKQSEFHLNAFRSPNVPLLGELGIHLRLHGLHTPRRRGRIEMRNTVMNLNVQQRVIFPGMSPSVLEHDVAAGAEGLVIIGFGAGNVPTGSRSLVPAIGRAVSKGVAVVIGTQCTEGSVEPLYATGQAALQAGAISAGDMTHEMTIVKLMWALGQTPNTDDVRQIMEESYAHERAGSAAPRLLPQPLLTGHTHDVANIGVRAVANG